MRYRELGRTGLQVSLLTFGGIMLNDVPQVKANEVVKKAITEGINFFDVGPTYGNAQEILGSALEPYREIVTLACKTEPEQTKAEVKKDLMSSLNLLRTDFLDIYQLHEVTDEEALDKALAPGGALEAIQEAQDEGLVKYIGFSAHSEWAALKLMDAYNFDTVMFPVNWNYWFKEDQGKKVIAKARKTEKGIIAIKALAQRRWQAKEDRHDYKTWYKPVFDNEELAELALRFTLTRDIDTAVTPGDIRMLEYSLELFEKYEDSLSLSGEEYQKLQGFVDTHGGKLYPIPG
ncbi:MAG: aldo/keto reductase [Bacillota bacterium]